LLESGINVGVRETRRIVGAYQLTQDDVLDCADFPDSIGVNGWPVEAHVAGDVDIIFPRGDNPRGFNQLPFRMIMPRAVDNLYVAGRCASMTHGGQSAARVSGPCFAMGQAAGSAADLALIVGQKAVITKARKSIATFKVREGQAIGCKVTLRKARMYEFLDRLINIALPRMRDFRGLSPKSFDGRGNYTLGIKEHIVFPEIDYDKAADVWGMDITVCTTAHSDDEARALLRAFNFPFRQ